MSISERCIHCKTAPIADKVWNGFTLTVTYACSSNSIHNRDPSVPAQINTYNNKCTFIPPPGVSENPDDWTDFYKNETYEQSAYNTHLEMMGDRFQWLHELADLYKALVEDLSRNQPLEHETLMLVQTCVTARTELITAFRALAKGYPTDCRLKTRLVVEYAIFAARAVEKPDTAKLWLAAGYSEDDWNRYRQNFKIYYLLEKDESWKVLVSLKPQIRRLADQYAHLSQYTHATVLASGLQASGVQVTLRTSFVENLEERQFCGLFAELIDVHLDVVNLMVKLAEFVKLEVNSGIFEMVKVLEEDVNNLLEQVNNTPSEDSTKSPTAQ